MRNVKPITPSQAAIEYFNENVHYCMECLHHKVKGLARHDLEINPNKLRIDILKKIKQGVNHESIQTTLPKKLQEDKHALFVIKVLLMWTHDPSTQDSMTPAERFDLNRSHYAWLQQWMQEQLENTINSYKELLVPFTQDEVEQFKSNREEALAAIKDDTSRALFTPDQLVDLGTNTAFRSNVVEILVNTRNALDSFTKLQLGQLANNSNELAIMLMNSALDGGPIPNYTMGDLKSIILKPNLNGSISLKDVALTYNRLKDIATYFFERQEEASVSELCGFTRHTKLAQLLLINIKDEFVIRLDKDVLNTALSGLDTSHISEGRVLWMLAEDNVRNKLNYSNLAKLICSSRNPIEFAIKNLMGEISNELKFTLLDNNQANNEEKMLLKVNLASKHELTYRQFTSIYDSCSELEKEQLVRENVAFLSQKFYTNAKLQDKLDKLLLFIIKLTEDIKDINITPLLIFTLKNVKLLTTQEIELIFNLIDLTEFFGFQVDLLVNDNEQCARALLKLNNWERYVSNPPRLIEHISKTYPKILEEESQDKRPSLNSNSEPLHQTETSVMQPPTLFSEQSRSRRYIKRIERKKGEIKCDHRIKLHIVGDDYTGKSSLILRFTDDEFNESPMGTALKYKNLLIGRELKNILLQIWDYTHRIEGANQPEKVDGIILLYDITNKSSFQNIIKRYEDAKRLSPKYDKIILVGTKSDLENRRVVPYETAKELADKMRWEYIEASAKTGYNVGRIFGSLTHDLCLEKGYIQNNDNQPDEGAMEGKSKCLVM